MMTSPTRRGAASRSRAGQVDRGRGWAFIVPFAIVAVMFLIIPTLWGLYLSFTNESLMGNGMWVGLRNYVEALSDATMWTTLGHTVWFTVLTTVPLVVLSLVMAIIVYLGIPGQWLWRFSFFAPYLLPSAVVVNIWTWMFNQDIGLFNFWLSLLGIEPVGWLSDEKVAMVSMAMLTVWWTVGFNFLLYLSALQAIPDQLYEAAAIDGAGVWRKLWSVTLPQLRGVTVVISILQVLASLKVFDQMWIAFSGGSGPGGTTRPILQYIYDSGFTSYRMGYASSMSYIFFAIIIVLTIGIQYLSRRSRQGGVK